MRLARRQRVGREKPERAGTRMGEVRPAGRRGGGRHAVRVAAKISRRGVSVMVPVVSEGRGLISVIAMGGTVIVWSNLQERLGLCGIHGRLGHYHHARLKRGDDEQGEREKSANERPPRSAMSARIHHSSTFDICRDRKSSINAQMNAQLTKRDHPPVCPKRCRCS